MALGLPIETTNVLIGASIALVTAVTIEGYRIWSHRRSLRASLIEEITQIKHDLVYILDAIYVRQVGKEKARPELRYGVLVPDTFVDDPPYKLDPVHLTSARPDNDRPIADWMAESGNSAEDDFFNMQIGERIDAAVNHTPVYNSNTSAIGALPSAETLATVRFYRTLDRISVDVDPLQNPGLVQSWAYVCEVRANQAVETLER